MSQVSSKGQPVEMFVVAAPMSPSWIAGACLAIGRCPWTDRRVEPVVVAYLDFEMTEDDLQDRAEDMGFGPDDLANLRSSCTPASPCSTRPRAAGRCSACSTPLARALVIDTFGRVIVGEDFTGADVRAFHRWSAIHVKARGISVARLDHTGYLDQTRAKGSSAKGADVDVGWVIQQGDAGALRLAHHGLAGMPWVPSTST